MIELLIFGAFVLVTVFFVHVVLPAYYSFALKRYTKRIVVEYAPKLADIEKRQQLAAKRLKDIGVSAETASKKWGVSGE